MQTVGYFTNMFQISTFHDIWFSRKLTLTSSTIFQKFAKFGKFASKVIFKIFTEI